VLESAIDEMGCAKPLWFPLDGQGYLFAVAMRFGITAGQMRPARRAKCVQGLCFFIEHWPRSRTMMPAPFEGAFIPAGNTFDAMTAVTKIFARAKAELLIVDPYLDEKILTEFAIRPGSQLRAGAFERAHLD
jgi:hypothetical protein